MFRKFLISLWVRMIQHQKYQIKSTQDRIRNFDVILNILGFTTQLKDFIQFYL